jgi:hypothetical protein
MMHVPLNVRFVKVNVTAVVTDSLHPSVYEPFVLLQSLIDVLTVSLYGGNCCRYAMFSQ